jgi:hypothetical protein
MGAAPGIAYGLSKLGADEEDARDWRGIMNPFIPPKNPIAVDPAKARILTDPNLDYMQKVDAVQFVDRATLGQQGGWISPMTFVRAAVGAGIGGAGASLIAKVLGAPQNVQSLAFKAGLVAGALKNTGVIK